MEASQIRIAQLDKSKMEAIKSLEQKMGTCLVAYEREVGLAKLSNEQLSALKKAETDLGVILLAYECR